MDIELIAAEVACEERKGLFLVDLLPLIEKTHCFSHFARLRPVHCAHELDDKFLVFDNRVPKSPKEIPSLSRKLHEVDNLSNPFQLFRLVVVRLEMLRCNRVFSRHVEVLADNWIGRFLQLLGLIDVQRDVHRQRVEELAHS